MTVADHPEASTDEKSAPEFKQGLRDKNLQEGSDVKLECRAEGFPIPKVNWYKNDEMIKATIGKYTMSVSFLIVEKKFAMHSIILYKEDVWWMHFLCKLSR